ncbi:MAG: hypothetical protein RLZZ628_2029 [Bacteroidota bacterium]|jgi:hypothetical protein
MAKNAYQHLQAAKKKHCEGKILKTDLNEAGKKYVARSVKNGMDEKEAKKKAESVIDDTCTISGVKKRKSTAKVGATATVKAQIKSLKAQIGKLEKAVKGTKAPKKATKAVGSTKKRKPAVGTKAKKAVKGTRGKKK